MFAVLLSHLGDILESSEDSLVGRPAMTPNQTCR